MINDEVEVEVKKALEEGASEERLQALDYIQQAIALNNTDHYDDAIVLLEKAIEIDPMFPECYIQMGNTYMLKSEYVDAEKMYKKALLLDKNLGIAYFNIGNIYSLTGNADEAILNYNKALSSGYDNDDIEYFITLAYEEKKDIDLALRHVTKAIAFNPNRAGLRVKKMMLYITKGELEDALKIADELILANGELFEGYHFKFEILCAMNKMQEAEETIDIALARFPEDMGFIYDKVKCLAMLERFDEALSLIDKSEEIEGYDRQKSNLLYLKAQIYGQQEKIEEAYKTAKIALECENPGEPNEDIRYFLMNLSLVFKDFEMNYKYASELVEMHNENYFFRAALYYQAFSAKKLNRENWKDLYKKAITYYRNATLKDPGQIEAYLYRAMSLKDIGDYEKAQEMLAVIETLVGDIPEIHIVRAEIYEEQNDEKNAKIEREKVVALKPEMKDIYAGKGNE